MRSNRITLAKSWTSYSRGSCLVGLAPLFTSVTALGLSLSSTAPWLQLIGPVIITWCALYFVWLVYFWRRKASFERRQRRRNEHPAEKLDIPARVKKLEQYDGGQTLNEAQWTYIGRAVEAQGQYFASGILVAILPPLALFLLSVEPLKLWADPNWGIGLILSEMSCLIILVYLAMTSPEPTAEWIENRVRTELFRREQYLFLAGVGPYLFQKPSEAVEETLRRRGQIEGADARTLIALVPMQERSGLTWLEALRDEGSAKLPGRSDFADRMETYLYYRIGKQLVWFANEIRDIQENEKMWSRALTFALLLAIAVAALHAFQLYKRADTASEKLIDTLALALPPLGMVGLSIRGMYNFRGRSRVYEHEKRLLHAHKGALEALIKEATGSSGRVLEKIDFKFRAVALRTEQSLSFELEQWLLLMERREHEVSP